MTCNEIDAQDLIECYLAGGLEEAERQKFEDHYFGCDDCFERLKIARAMRATRDSRDGMFWSTFSHSLRRSVWQPIAALIAIALLGTLYLKSPSSRTAPVEQATDRIAERSPIENNAVKEESLTSQLAHVEPPPYAPRGCVRRKTKVGFSLRGR